MKRKIIQLGIIALCLLGSLYFNNIQSHNDALTDLAFENIEALASGEGPNENFMCYNWGDIECHGIKVERKTTGLR